MATLHLLAGSNGAGKSTFVASAIGPMTGLPFINADVMAAEKWPGDEEAHAYDASHAAAQMRARALSRGESFITETVFSHPNKLDLVVRAQELGYRVKLYVIMVPLTTTQNRVLERVDDGGHSVPREKISERYARLWSLFRRAREIADVTKVYDNSLAEAPFKLVAKYSHGVLDASHEYPNWAPLPL